MYNNTLVTSLNILIVLFFKNWNQNEEYKLQEFYNFNDLL